MSLDWPTAWDVNAWGVALSAFAALAAVVAAVLAGGARRAAREQRGGFQRARLLRALDDCREVVEQARRIIDGGPTASQLAGALDGWNEAAGDVAANLYDGCGIDDATAGGLLHSLDSVGRERSLLLVWLDVGAAADAAPLRAALLEAARLLGAVRSEIERRTER